EGLERAEVEEADGVAVAALGEGPAEEGVEVHLGDVLGVEEEGALPPGAGVAAGEEAGAAGAEDADEHEGQDERRQRRPEDPPEPRRRAPRDGLEERAVDP